MLLVALGAVAGTAPAVSQESIPSPITLGQGWEFQADPTDRGLRAGWADGGAPAEGWRGVSVPHVVDATPDKVEFGGSVGWYRLRFDGPETDAVDWALRFEQARREAQVWLNGTAIGRHDDPYVPFTLVARGLRKGQPNELVVRVDYRKDKEPREGWWNWGGLVRPVTLVPLGPLRLTDQALLSDVRCEAPPTCRARVLVRGTVENRSDSPIARPEVRVRLTGPDGGSTVATGAHAVRALMPGETAEVAFAVEVADPELWSPERPALYGATLTTLADGRAVQVDERRTGLREVRVRNGLLELNGRQLEVRGASIQEDLPGRGPALRDEDIATIVAELKAVGANITRAHYLLNPKLLDALDAAGIMVWSQAPVYHRDRLLRTAAQRETALATVRDTVREARSHPSVITHSVANELSVIPDRVPGTRRFLLDALAATRRLDPTLPVSVDLLSYPGYPASRTYAQYDLLGINSYFGWYPGKEDHSTARLADLGPYLDRMRRQYPTQAMVVTEFGAEAIFDGPAEVKESFAFQADYVARILAIVGDRPFVGGAIYWTLREFAVKPDWDGGAKRKGSPRDPIHSKALLTYAGRPKPAWEVARRDFTATPLYREVSAATGLALPDGRGGGGGTGLLALVVGLVVGLIALDVWAVAGLLRARRRALGAES